MGDPGKALHPVHGPEELLLAQPAAAVPPLKPRLRVNAVLVRTPDVAPPAAEENLPAEANQSGADEPPAPGMSTATAAFEPGALCLAPTADDPPFDAPEEADFLPAPEDAPSEPRRPHVLVLTTEPSPESTPIIIRSPSPATPIALAPDRHIYLAMARGAALDEERRERDGATVRRAIAASVTAGLALPLLLGALLALNNDADLGPAAAPAATPTAAHVQPVAPSQARAAASEPTDDYRRALQMLSSDRAREAIAPLQRAAESGHALAQYRLAKLYEHGEGVPLDLSLARQWTERAARSGNVPAMHDIGVYLAEGEGAERDESAAFQWFQQAADFGVPDSQFNLGILYQQGRGVAADATEALYWFLVASRHSDVKAFDRALEIAVQLPRTQVSQVQVRARAFHPREPDRAANDTSEAPA